MTTTSDADNSDQPGGAASPSPASEKNVASQSALNSAAALLRQTQALTARENAVQLREKSVDFRENQVAEREQEIHSLDMLQAATDEHLVLLRRANENLVVTTIDAQKLAEQLLATQAELEKAKLIAEQASLAKSNFLSSMSHELRTPLNAILGFAQLLEAGSPPPTEAQMLRLQQIIKGGWYLLELINEILDLSKIESGKLALSFESVSLADLMRECQAMIEPLAQKNTITLNFAPVDPDMHIHADRTRLKQALINLLSNAIKYNRKNGSVEVLCSANHPERIRISVKDSGEGLTAENMTQLFLPFNRLGQESSSKEGTGIGLVVTKQLIELMGGTIGAESSVGVGSTFWVELIRDVTAQKSNAKSSAEILPAVKTHVALHTLLYVEDNPANLMLVEHIIADFPDVRMLSAHNGTLGVALARIHLPDVILMDINLPGISGIEALNILRNDPATAHIPVIALSANAMKRDIGRGLAAGFFRYLTKPIKIHEFIDALEEALEISKAKLPVTDKPE